MGQDQLSKVTVYWLDKVIYFWSSTLKNRFLINFYAPICWSVFSIMLVDFSSFYWSGSQYPAYRLHRFLISSIYMHLPLQTKYENIYKFTKSLLGSSFRDKSEQKNIAWMRWKQENVEEGHVGSCDANRSNEKQNQRAR